MQRDDVSQFTGKDFSFAGIGLLNHSGLDLGDPFMALSHNYTNSVV